MTVVLEYQRLVPDTLLFRRTLHRTWIPPPLRPRHYSANVPQKFRRYAFPLPSFFRTPLHSETEGQPTTRGSLQQAPRGLARIRPVDNSTINRTRSAEATRYNRSRPFLGRAWQVMVLTRAERGTTAGHRTVAVPTAAAAREGVLRLKRRGELATEVKLCPLHW